MSKTCLVAQQALPCLAFPTRVFCHYSVFHPSLSPAFPRQGCHLAFLLGCYFSHRGCDKPSGGGLGGVKRAENMIKKFCMIKISNKNNKERGNATFLLESPPANQTKAIRFPWQQLSVSHEGVVSIQVHWTFPLSRLPLLPPRPIPYIPAAMSSPLLVPSRVTGPVLLNCFSFPSPNSSLAGDHTSNHSCVEDPSDPNYNSFLSSGNTELHCLSQKLKEWHFNLTLLYSFLK